MGENVFGFTTWSNGMVFETCCSDLENLGYSVQSFVIPACAIGANHRRDRCWIIAYSDNARANNALRNNRKRQAQNEGREGQSLTKFGQGHGDATDTNSDRLEGGVPTDEHRQQQSEEGSIEERLSASRQTISLEGFPTEPPICGGDDGLSKGLDKITFSKWRKEGVKAYGNAIVPQIAFNIFQTIVDFEKNNLPKPTNK